jgi:hypothetical protein
VLVAIVQLIAFVSGVLPTPDLLPSCPEGERCAAIRLWISPGPEGFDDLTFVTTQLTQANVHHGPAGLGFQVVEVRAFDASTITTRAERDTLGHDRWQRGLIDVYVVSSLANVDEPGEIRGVHWRSRKDRTRRWVILSRISPSRVLAHELGHYFGLAHSLVPASLMNTSGNALAERSFQPDELAKIRRRAKALFGDGTVRDPRQGKKGPR